jgi:DNA polymerase III sliding clamp (beta) subunit (PCNA family)
VSKAKFYVATFNAAIERVSRIAPTKGTAFDKAAGIVLEVDPDTKTASLRATNLEVFYREEIRDVVDYGTEHVTWRLPSVLFSGIINGLPLDKEVTIKSDGERQVRIFCGKKQAKLKTMPTDIYPEWDRVDPDGLEVASGFAARVSQVAWATDRDNDPFTGINIDGKNLNATDKYRLARVPCDVPLEKPVTVAMTTLAPILKNLPGEISLAADGDKLLMRVGDEIEAISVIFAKPFPDLSKALREDFSLEVKVNREALRDAIESMLVLVKQERYPRMNVEIDDGGISLFMAVPETGDMNDVVEAEVPSGETFAFDVTPEFLLRAVDGAAGKNITLSVGPDRKQMVRVKDGDYIAYLMPLSDVKTTT